MGDQDKSIFIILKIALQPFNMLFVQIVGRLVQKQDIRLFQKQLCQEGPWFADRRVSSVTSRSRPISSQSQCPANFLYFCVDHVKIMAESKVSWMVPSSSIMSIHLFRRGISHIVADDDSSVLPFQRDRTKADFNTSRMVMPFFEDSMLVQIADMDIFGPFDLAFIRHQFSGDNVHKSGFSFAVGTYQTDMFAF